MSAIIANAPVDLVGRIDEAFLVSHALPKGGTLTLPEGEAFAALLEDFVRAAADAGGIEVHPGGCGANTAASLATLGGDVTLIAPFGTGPHGDMARADLRARGVKVAGFDVPEPHLAILTAITPDGERSFALAARPGYPRFARELAGVSGQRTILLDGYLLEDPLSAAAILRHVEHAMPSEQELVACPNGAEIITGAREPLRALLARASHILLSENEALALTASTLPEDAAKRLRGLGLAGAITLGARGALLFDESGSLEVPAQSLARDEIVNMNGAGDAFAAGYLLARQRGLGLAETGAMGCACAAEVIRRDGARLPA